MVERLTITRLGRRGDGIADGIQGIAAGALRVLNDTRVPLLYAALCFWLVGFNSAYALAFWSGIALSFQK